MQGPDGSLRLPGDYVLATKDNGLTDSTQMKGTPYLMPSWCPGYLVTLQGLKVDEVLLMFNVTEGYLKYRSPKSDESFIINHDLIKGFGLFAPDSTYTFEKFLVPLQHQTEGMEEFFTVLDSGSYLLLARPSKQLRKTGQAPTSAVTDEPSRYMGKVDYFIRRPDRAVLLVKSQSKRLSEIFGADYESVKTFARREKLKWKKKGDLIAIVRFANGKP